VRTGRWSEARGWLALVLSLVCHREIFSVVLMRPGQVNRRSAATPPTAATRLEAHALGGLRMNSVEAI
jgi:hypothetical protein